MRKSRSVTTSSIMKLKIRLTINSVIVEMNNDLKKNKIKKKVYFYTKLVPSCLSARRLKRPSLWKTK